MRGHVRGLLASSALVLWRCRRDAVQLIFPTPTVQSGASRAVREPVSRDGVSDLGIASSALGCGGAQTLGETIRVGSQGVSGMEPLAPEVVVEVRSLLASRRKIAAIKLVREHSGWGLKESTNSVDLLTT